MDRDPPRDGPGRPREDIELELKLLLDPADLPRLRRHPSIQALASGPGSTSRLHSTYYDTEAQDLLRSGVALRVRRDGQSYVQTVKTDADASVGLFARIEVEAALPEPHPDIERVTHPELRARIERAIGPRPLLPVLETDFRRTKRRLLDGSAEISFDLDQGEIRTPHASAPICELELELVDGDERGLYELALSLLDSVPFRVGTLSKYARGVALRTGERPVPKRGARIQLARTASLEEALEHIMRSGVSQILVNDEPARDGVDPEGVHQMRVGARRLRSAFTLFRTVLPEPIVAPIVRDLRWLGGELGPARDLDVFVVECLEPLVQRFPQQVALKRLREEADLLRAESYERVQRALRSPRYTELILQLGLMLAGRRWRQQALTPQAAGLFQSASEHASRLLRRRLKRSLERGHRIEERTTPERHELRIELKKLRYAQEFLHSLFPERSSGRVRRRTVRLQDALGHLNDVATAEDILSQLVERLDREAGPSHLQAIGFVLGWVAASADREFERLPRLWRRFEKSARLWRKTH